MPSMQKPNLFTYATSELSQDAIICWLLEWAKAENKEIDNALHLVGISFLDSLFAKFDEIKIPHHYDTIKINKQYKQIDIFCIVNDEYALIIEDKTNTKNHSGQLEKYFNEINKTFDKSKILPIYFKTGDQSNYSEIIDNGYRIYLRKDFLTVLDNPFENDILYDYKSYLQKIENGINSYKIRPFSEWTYSSVKGFYIALQKELGDGNWDYVANASGGFLGFWWNGHQLDGYKIYMQIDAKKKSVEAKKIIDMQLKFKLSSVSKVKVDKKIVNFWKHHIVYADKEFSIKKPIVVRAGRTTTIGIVDKFWTCNAEDRIDVKKTVLNLKKLEDILTHKIEQIHKV